MSQNPFFFFFFFLGGGGGGGGGKGTGGPCTLESKINVNKANQIFGRLQ